MYDSEEDDDDFIAQQSALMQAKYGVEAKKQNPLGAEKKKIFDSADHEMKMQQMREAAGMGPHGEGGSPHGQEEEKKEESWEKDDVIELRVFKSEISF